MTAQLRRSHLGLGEVDADVIVAGAGPTGLMLAGELRLAGVRTIVVDRLTEPAPHPRALGFSARAIELFDQRGLLPGFGEVNVIPVASFGGLHLDYRVVDGGSYGARGIPQPLTESVLARWATNLGAELRRGHDVTGLDAHADSVEVKVSTACGPALLRARYVVGCDGAQSTVRELAGIGFAGTAPTFQVWLVDLTGCRLRPRVAGKYVPGGWIMVLPLGPDRYRVLLHEKESEPSRSPQPPAFSEVSDAYKRLTGEDIQGAQPQWVSSFTDASGLATQYRKHRVFLAGDAAHVSFPIGAQCMSTGIEDAVNLGWKLAAEVRGHAPPGLLDSYHTERHPVGAQMAASTLAQGMLRHGGSDLDPVRQVLSELLAYPQVRRHLAGIVTGLDVCYDAGASDHPLLGRRLPKRALRHVPGQGGSLTTFDLLHAGRGVLLDLAGDATLPAAAAPWADRVDVVTAVPDATSAMAPLDEIDAALVRPDGHLAWIRANGSPADDLQAAVTRWFGQPVNPTE